MVRRDGHGEAPATDPVRLLLDLRTTAGVTAATAAHLVKELRATQVADCHLAAGGATAAGLLELDHHEIEGEMGGHPWIAPNKGRLGFGYADYLRYAPERRAPVRLHWLAARAGVASYQAVPGLPHDRLLAGELDPATAGALHRHPGRHRRRPRRLPLVPGARLAVGARGRAPVRAQPGRRRPGPARPGARRVPAPAVDPHLANRTTPRRHHLKLPLSILNTLVWRGLPTDGRWPPPRSPRSSPASWPPTRSWAPTGGWSCSARCASLAVAHPDYETLPGAPYQYRELLGCIWREPPPAAARGPGERAMTLAALLHRDRRGAPWPRPWSPVGPGRRAPGWRPLFDAVLPPLLHFLYRYGTAFSPHGENAIVVHDERTSPPAWPSRTSSTTSTCPTSRCPSWPRP